MPLSVVMNYYLKLKFKVPNISGCTGMLYITKGKNLTNSLEGYNFNNYLPQTKLEEGNVFTCVCLVERGRVVHHMHHGIGHIPYSPYPPWDTLPLDIRAGDLFKRVHFSPHPPVLTSSGGSLLECFLVEYINNR